MSSRAAIYDRIGKDYRRHRVPDPRIEAQIHSALGSARRVCNVGAGAGSYEPRDRDVIAVEPSREMIAQHPQHPSGSLVCGVAETLPFADASFDAVLASLTVHHWRDVAAGLAEMRRIAPRRVVFTFDPSLQDRFWLARDYVPAVASLETGRAPSIDLVKRALGGSRVDVVPIAWDCRDGFQCAYWRRPERYLDPSVRAGISTLAQLPPEQVEPGLERLAEDLRSGAWAERNAELLERDSMDWGYRLVISEEAA